MAPYNPYSMLNNVMIDITKFYFINILLFTFTSFHYVYHGVYSSYDTLLGYIYSKRFLFLIPFWSKHLPMSFICKYNYIYTK